MRFPIALKSFVSLAVVLVAGGCGTIGEREFACPGRPPGVRCLSATGVYAATEGTAVVAPTADHAIGNGNLPARKDHESNVEKRTHEKSYDSRTVGTAVPRALMIGTALPAVEKPVPIRTPAQVMRVWIAPWEDTRGILHGGGYHFVEIEARRWAFGESVGSGEPARFFSIQTTATADKKQSEVKEPPAAESRAGTSDRSKKSASSSSSNPGASK